MMSEPEYLGGRMLLAMPGMGDPRFDRAVIVMCIHDANSALGIGIGHLRAGIGFHALLAEVGIEPGVAPDCPVHHGGPVEPGRGFVLHSPEWSDRGTWSVNRHCAMTATREVLSAIAEGRGPARWLIALGYAGWSAGQLDGEMCRHGWGTTQARPEILFDTPADLRWTGAWRAEGIDPALLSNVTGRA